MCLNIDLLTRMAVVSRLSGDSTIHLALDIRADWRASPQPHRGRMLLPGFENERMRDSHLVWLGDDRVHTRGFGLFWVLHLPCGLDAFG